MSVKCGLKCTQAGFLNPFGLISHKVENLPCSKADALECRPGKRLPPRVEEEFKGIPLPEDWQSGICEVGSYPLLRTVLGRFVHFRQATDKPSVVDYFCMTFSINLKKNVLEARFSSFSVTSNPETNGLLARMDSLKMYKYCQSPSLIHISKYAL